LEVGCLKQNPIRSENQSITSGWWGRPLGETWAIGIEIYLAKHLNRWHGDVNVVPRCGDACMDCDPMS